MEYAELLRSWDKLNAFIMDAPEEQIKELLDLEMKGRKRFTIIDRLYGRYSRVRAKRERADLFRRALPKK